MEIILKAVSKKIGYTQVLDNINCLFLGGKIYGIVGYNGSGKTMLLRTIAGLVIPRIPFMANLERSVTA